MRVLLDTSFILPTLGFNVGGEVIEGLKRLRRIKAEIYVSRFSILEVLWLCARLIREGRFNGEVFGLGLRSVLEGGRYVMIEENTDIFIEALKLYGLGHKDMVDNILYASSLYYNLKLLTVDVELRKFIRSNGLKDTTIYPSEISL